MLRTMMVKDVDESIITEKMVVVTIIEMSTIVTTLIFSMPFLGMTMTKNGSGKAP